MGQAKLRQQAQAALADAPKAQIAEAVRSSVDLGRAHTGTCLHQALIGKLVLRRYGRAAVLMAGDFRRPLGDGYQHTYTREDDRISVWTGAFHAWLFCPQTNEVIDFAAWEAPFRMEQEAGKPWLGPRPDYLWESEAGLRRQGFAIMPDADATATVRRFEAWATGGISDAAEAALFLRYGDADLIRAGEARALKSLRLELDGQ